MSLIWAESFTGERALARLWQKYFALAARAEDTTLKPEELGEAMIAKKIAAAAYDDAVREAATTAAPGSNETPRTHALVIGVGKYASSVITPIKTSVRGAWAFTEWLLTGFHNDDRPLASVELLLSPAVELGNWRPSAEAASKLEIDVGSELPVEPATHANIKGAFDRWLQRAKHNERNMGFVYFSGHGLWKSTPLLLAEDAQLANRSVGFANLIDIHLTEENMFNTAPQVQCFFIDACQKITSALLESTDARPGQPLLPPSNAAAIRERDACQFIGSCPGGPAYGPDNEPPYFTQELLACLQRRGANTHVVDNEWRVTTNSLRLALEAASRWRSEVEDSAKQIKFSSHPGFCTFSAELCQIMQQPEVFVKVSCRPSEAIKKAKLYVKYGGKDYPRSAVMEREWYTKVDYGQCQAGANFDPQVALASPTSTFSAVPPLHPIELRVELRH
jgi:hypothetical protein